jgi:hypothetical protein
MFPQDLLPRTNYIVVTALSLSNGFFECPHSSWASINLRAAFVEKQGTLAELENARLSEPMLQLQVPPN